MPRLRKLAIATCIPLFAAGLNLTTGGSLLAQEQPERDCDPSYLDVCIPPPEPDLDCNDVKHRNFRVEGDDPHNFDEDSDGVGCERHNNHPIDPDDVGSPSGSTHSGPGLR